MTVKTVYPHTISQSSGSNIQSFNNLSNLKNDNSTYAKTGQIASKSGTRKKPASITAKNFKANIPSGSKINKVTVEYAADYEGNITIGKPTINILNIKGDNKNGKALTKTLTKTSVSWSGDHTIANMNSSDFGVSISFPANTKADVGYVKLKYIRIIIDYTAPNYKVSSSKISGVYTNDEFKVKVNASNVNKTTGDSNVIIQLPSGVSYNGKDSGDGSVSASGSKLTWKPGLSAKKLSASIILKLKITTNGSHNISISEAATGHNTSLNISTSARPAPVPTPTPAGGGGDEEPPEPKKGDDSTSIPTEKPTPTNVLQVAVNEEFSLDLSFEDYSGSSVKLYAYYNDYTFDTTDGELFGEDVQYNSAWSSGRTNKIYIYSQSMSQWAFRQINSWDYYNKKWTVMSYNLITGGLMQNLFKVTEAGYYTILMYSSDGETLLKKVLISVKPDTLSTPSMTILKLTQEELNRLGEGIVYTVQSYMKLISNQPFVRDWGKNFKIGVFNNINPNVDTTTEITETVVEDGDEISIEPTETDVVDNTDYENLTNAQILEYAEYWSEPLTVLNEFTNVTCSFVYNSNYPVYIIITGDYPEGDPLYNTIQFTEPCVVESRVYNGHENNGNYPIPILNLLENSDSAEIELKLFEKGTDMVIYQFPLDADFSVSETLAITGIEVSGDIDFADAVIVNAKLCKPGGDFGERSIIINDPQKEDDDSSFSIGGPYDLWRFNMSEIENLEKWWVEFSLNNLFDNTNDLAEVKFKNIQLTIYTNKVKSNYQKVYVEGQNVRHLGMFVTKANVPEGLLMDTKYANIDGTDTNDAYRMNVKPKEIEIEFSVRGCDLQETTNMLRQLAKLFVNDRDELNRPIKKRLELSNYPDVYFMYLMNDPFDSDPTVAGYKSKLKLEIPDGTAFSKEDTVTSNVGINHGLAKVNPVITFIPTGDIVELTESVNNQKFKITCKDWTVENTVEIDCINRKITILDYVDSEGNIIEKDITSDGDINNDWFVLHKEYNFETDNCILQTVRFTERW